MIKLDIAPPERLLHFDGDKYLFDRDGRRPGNMDKKTCVRGGVRCRLSESSTKEDGVGGLHRADRMGVY